MLLISGKLRLAATDVSNHLACRHLTNLELSAARGEREKPQWQAPDLVVIRELGLRHEQNYLKHLEANGCEVVNLSNAGSEPRIFEETCAAMRRGVQVIAQGALSVDKWFGRPDVLRKVDTRPSRFGNWSYEAYDCKLSRETKATAVLQLGLYSELLAEIQGATPEFMWVVPPGSDYRSEPYRVAEYAAYYRHVKQRLEQACAEGTPVDTYAEPCEHCEVCRWLGECDERRRADDHLSQVAGIRRLQRDQLEAWNTETMAKLALMPIPLKQKPLHGSREGLEKVREQARVQVEGRMSGKAVHELLAVVDGTGFCKLPEPSPGDVFVDLEGDPFAGDCGQQYLFGFAAADGTQGNELRYEKRWAFTADEEKRSFEWFVDEVMSRFEKFAAMHVYHFGAYEPAAFKRLMGRYATREDQIDRMLRAGLFVDLHMIFKQAVRASVEEYSLKKLEIFYDFRRKVPPEQSRAAMRFVEHRLELGWDENDFRDEFRAALEGYNGEDCRSAAALRDWLEKQRHKVVQQGASVPRPKIGDGAPTEELDARQKRVAALTADLTARVPADPAARTPQQSALWLLAQLLDWHRRENKAAYWEGFRLKDLDDNQLLEDRAGLAGLRCVGRVGIENKVPIDRYSFEKQETEVRAEKEIYCKGERFGKAVEVDLLKLTVDIKKTKKSAEFHPSAIYAWDRPVNTDSHADSLLRTGDWVKENGIDAPGQFRALRDLLLRNPPRLLRGELIAALPGEETKATACRIASALNESVFAIQGPPGAGKTYTGARMICRLVSQGKKIGITALSHKVIRKLLEEVVAAASQDAIPGVKCMQKLNEPQELDPSEKIAIVTDNGEALAALQSGAANVVGGTSWLWTRAESSNSVDALFIDEAGQMALADVLAVGQAAHNLVLIGDPQQLERPLKGSHPPGAEKSALEHLIGDHKTIPPSLGMLLPETWRMHPKICAFISEVFYEGRLQSRDLLQHRVLETSAAGAKPLSLFPLDHPWLNGAGLWFVPVQHTGNRNSSTEEANVVDAIVRRLTQRGVRWYRCGRNTKQVELDDVLIVAPYNAQVSDLLVKLPQGARVGTVDKFQGQEAAVVIYSLTTSSPEDAPRGMEFLYSLNRFNVATSRAMTAVIVVGSPKLFEPECKSPRQMQLANAFCAYLEKATTIDARAMEEGYWNVIQLELK